MLFINLYIHLYIYKHVSSKSIYLISNRLFNMTQNSENAISFEQTPIIKALSVKMQTY